MPPSAGLSAYIEGGSTRGNAPEAGESGRAASLWATEGEPTSPAVAPAALLHWLDGQSFDEFIAVEIDTEGRVCAVMTA